VPQNYGANLTIMGALSRRGLEAPMTVEGSTDGEVFYRLMRYRSLTDFHVLQLVINRVNKLVN
jgi:hypothetical protein